MNCRSFSNRVSSLQFWIVPRTAYQAVRARQVGGVQWSKCPSVVELQVRNEDLRIRDDGDIAVEEHVSRHVNKLILQTSLPIHAKACPWVAIQDLPLPNSRRRIRGAVRTLTGRKETIKHSTRATI